MKIAAIADLHVTVQDANKYQDFFTAISSQADVVLLGGDLTDTGKAEEAELLAEFTTACRIPVFGVLGNHDHESNQSHDIIEILTQGNCSILQGDLRVVDDVTFVGVKGFGGGFDGHLLSSWGEEATKAFVHEAVDEALKLDSALARVKTEKKVVLLHYAPIRATVEGEPLEIFPFLGCSRLEGAIDRRSVTAVFHGHAHRGNFEGKTAHGVRVYNVTMRNIEEKFPEQKCFIFDV